VTDRSLSILIHGHSKSGKSSLAVTCPAPRLYLDVESASRFLAIKPVRWDPSTQPPPTPDGTWDTAVVATRDWATVQRAHQWLASGKHPFKSLIIDSISELQQRYIEGQVGRNQPTRDVWGSTYREVTGLVRDLRDLTMHPTLPLQAIVLTAMTRQIDGIYRPWCQGQLQTVLPYLLDVTGYLWTEQAVDELSGEQVEIRKMLTRRTNQFEAGERVDGRIPAVVEIQQREPGVPGSDIDQMLNMIFPPTEPIPTEPTPEPQPTEPQPTSPPEQDITND
jgi:AAA domain